MNLHATAIEPLGDRAVVLRFGDTIDPPTSRRVIAAWQAIGRSTLPGIVDLVPAYTTLTVHYDWQAISDLAGETPWLWLAARIGDLLVDLRNDDVPMPRQVDVPVCYDARFAPDLADVAAATGLSTGEVIRLHSSGHYTVAFLGFRPGFPYLLGLDPQLSVPRLVTPRTRIPAGSVGLGGAQTGVYTTDGPGGWRLIGRTPLALFDPGRAQPTVLRPGDRVRFVPIDADTFARDAGGVGGDAVDRAMDESRSVALGSDAMETAGDAAIEVMSPGIHSSLQDGGRPGWRHLGIGAGGACDTIAARLANALIGNPPDAAVLEMTLRGPDLRLRRPLVLALAGDGMVAFADGTPLPFARPVQVGGGVRLSFRSTGVGARAWLAVSGGFRSSRWLDSASVDFGGHVFGRALRAGDRLMAGPSPTATAVINGGGIAASRWWIDAKADIDAPMILRFVVDSEAGPDVATGLASRVWRVTLAADRTGVRLDGKALESLAGERRISAGVLHGTIQVPPDGLPILIGPDGQTTGGYPVAGHVIEADLPRLAQLKPGDLVWLQPLALADAHAARVAQATLLARLGIAISGKLRHA